MPGNMAYLYDFVSIISSPEPKAHKVSLYYSKAPSSSSTFSNNYISKNSWPILSVASFGEGEVH